MRERGFLTASEHSDDQPKGEANKRSFTLMGKGYFVGEGLSLDVGVAEGGSERFGRCGKGKG
jgi:hypothetical protein